MRIAMISICMLLIGISAYAEDFFPNSEIKDLQVYKVDKAQGTAWIRDRDGNKAVVAIDDKIGSEGRVVVKIGEALITVRLDQTRTRILLISGGDFFQDASSGQHILPFYPE